MWQQERNAAQCQATPVDRRMWDVIFSKENKSKREEKRGRYKSLYAIQFGVGSVDNEAVKEKKSVDNRLLFGEEYL